MIISKNKMDEINAVQYDIFKAFHIACQHLNLKYFLVHGSLLGAVRYQGFCPIDDDIDVAMPRKDYDIFMSQGQQFLDNRFFVQSHLSEVEYPMLFGKIRASDTTFIQPVLNRCDINKGIYIDIFPIDNYPTDPKQQRRLRFLERLYSKRVNRIFYDFFKPSIKTRLIGLFCCVIMPSWERTRDKLCSLYSNVPQTGKVIVRGGKISEVGISSDLFGKPVDIQFEDLQSFAPQKTGAYLNLIYGDYMNYDPMGKDMVSEDSVKISADIVDVHKSYKEYIHNINL